MYEILLPVDHSEERARHQAEYVTGLPWSDEVSVTVFFVFGPDTEDELPQELKPFNSAQRIASVREARRHLEDADIAVDIREDSGDTPAEILNAAAEEDVDEIVMGSHKRGPLASAIFGSVGESVITETALPVTIVGSPA